jgi:hypothetical protein
MPYTSECLHNAERKRISERRCENAKRKILWSMFFLIIGCTLASPRNIYSQWTTPDGNGNINSTNTGNVGVGNTTPRYKLDILGSANNAQIRFGMDSSDSGGFLFSIQPSHATFAAGASWSNFGWTARALNAASVTSDSGTLRFYTNQGLSPGAGFTPTERMRITAGGLVGMGTASPSSRLHVVSGTDTSTSMLSLDTGVHGGTQMSVAGTSNNESAFDMSVYRAGVYTSRFGVNAAGTVYLQPGGGNVGIGTSTPDTFARLHLYGSGGFGQDIQTTTNDWTRLRFISPTRTWGFFLDSQTGGLIPTGSFGLFDYTANLFRMVFHTNGNVGIGQNNPGFRLDVAGSVNSSGLCLNGVCKTDWSQIGGSSSQWANGANNSINYVAGSVGIGIPSPAFSLDINGGVNSFRAKAATTSSGDAIAAFENNSAIQMIIRGNGSVGIGTTAPLQRLQIGTNTPAATTTPDSISLGATYSSSAGANPKLRLWDNNAGSVYGLGVSNAQFDFMVPTTARYVWSVAGVEKMRLDENGNITIAGNINSKYQDLAEWVDSSQQLSAGTVVVLDASRSNQVIAATQSYDSRVAGVISLRPGIALGEASAGRVLVATTGRVKVKVDATYGPIQIGDLLVTSNREGFAMKSSPVEIGGVKIHRPGTLIGKALESLDKGTGEILVLLSLQ